MATAVPPLKATFHYTDTLVFCIVQCFAAFLLAVLFSSQWYNTPRLPILNAKHFWEPFGRRVLLQYLENAREMLREWFEKNPSSPVLVNSEIGAVLVLPGCMADEIKNDKRFHLRKQVERLMQGHLSGFEVFRDDHNNVLVKNVIHTELTRKLSNIITPLVEETETSLDHLFGTDTAWVVVPLQSTILQLVARVSSRIFLGSVLCREQEWIDITSQYAIESFMAALELRMLPTWLRPIANKLLPRCRRVRDLVARARTAIVSITEERARYSTSGGSRQSTANNDAIDWFEQAARGAPFRPEVVQLSLSTVAIHTTTDLLCQTLSDIAKHPEIVEPLRKEIDDILHDGEVLDEKSLGRMLLLDSCIKESQRIKPLSIASMGRVATESIVLSNGTIVPKGQSVLVDSSKMWSREAHPVRPEAWDGFRFYRMRDRHETEHIAPLVTTSAAHIAFGYGTHTCPGRFFAAAEIKIALIKILTKYDIELTDKLVPTSTDMGFTCVFNPSFEIRLRWRQKTSSR